MLLAELPQGHKRVTCGLQDYIWKLFLSEVEVCRFCCQQRSQGRWERVGEVKGWGGESILSGSSVTLTTSFSSSPLTSYLPQGFQRWTRVSQVTLESYFPCLRMSLFMFVYLIVSSYQLIRTSPSHLEITPSLKWESVRRRTPAVNALGILECFLLQEGNGLDVFLKAAPCICPFLS